MPSLHETTDLTKNIIKWGGIGLGGILLLILLFNGGKALSSILFPKKPPAPKIAFGKLPAIIFPDSVSKESFTYQLDTISGDLGTFPDRAVIYRMTPAVPTLLDLQNMRSSLSKTPFLQSETYITDTEYSWIDVNRPDKKLRANIISKDLVITSNYLTYPDFFATTIINEADAVEIATKFLTSFDLYPLDLDEEKTQSQLLSLQGTALFAATSLSNAQLVRVDFFQKNLNKYPIMYAHPPYSSMHFLIGGSDTREILEGQFKHQTVSKDSTTYPLLPVKDAYDRLKANKAYIASYYGTNGTVSIKNVYLAYFMSEDKQDYMMPIYVFEGKEGFFAYVSAISPDFIL